MIPRTAINSSLAEFFQEIWRYVEEMKGTVAGPPFSRIYQISGGELDLEGGVPVETHLPEKGRIMKGVLPGGEAAFTVHFGPYQQLDAAEGALDVRPTRGVLLALLPRQFLELEQVGFRSRGEGLGLALIVREDEQLELVVVHDRGHPTGNAIHVAVRALELERGFGPELVGL